MYWPTKPEKSERVLIKLIQRCERPIVLFVDDAHDLNGNTLRGLKRIIERVHRRRGRLSIVLAGHPKLRNDLRRPTLEEIGARGHGVRPRWPQGPAEGLSRLVAGPVHEAKDEAGGHPDRGGHGPAGPTAHHTAADRALSDTRSGAGVPFGRKPVTAQIVVATMAPDIDALEPTLIRYGYTAGALTELLNVRPGEVRTLLQGQLPEERTDELEQQHLRTGIPL
jgi:hypothetical protein